MTSQTGKQIIVIHLLPNISRSKGNQAMKLAQLMIYDMRNIFHEKWYTKCGGKSSLRHFPKNLKLSISLNQQCNVLYILFLLYIQVKRCRNILKLRYRPPAFTHVKLFLKKKRELELPSPSHFLYDFLKKYFSRSHLLTD